MKIFFSLLAVLYLGPAHASYYRNVCSSPDSEIRWEDSHGDNTIYFTYYDYQADQQKKIQFDVRAVNIKYLEKKTIKKIHLNDGCEASSDHYFHGRVKITPTAEIATEFKKAFKAAFVKDYIICHDHSSSETGSENCK